MRNIRPPIVAQRDVLYDQASAPNGPMSIFRPRHIRAALRRNEMRRSARPREDLRVRSAQASCESLASWPRRVTTILP